MELHVRGTLHRFLPPNGPQSHIDAESFRSQLFPGQMQTYRQVLIFTVPVNAVLLNLIQIYTNPCNRDKSQSFKVMCFNTQSCGNKTDDVCDLITQGKYDLVFLTETWR